MGAAPTSTTASDPFEPPTFAGGDGADSADGRDGTDSCDAETTVDCEP